MAHTADYAANDGLLHANVCASAPSSTSASPKFNIADFEHQFAPSHSALTAASTTAATRETSYASQAGLDDLDFAPSFSGAYEAIATRYARSLSTTSFLKRSASKLVPKAIATTNVQTTSSAPSPPSSGASSPTKSLSSFLSSNTSTLTSSASKASVRARTVSKVLFDNYFNGDSNKVHIGVLQPHSRSNSVVGSPAAPSYLYEDGYEPDCENMTTPSYTRSPLRTRPRRSPTAESATPTYAGKLGAWWNSSKQSSPKLSSPTTSIASKQEDDPLLHLDIQSALFPHGPVDPLNPASFNDLLTAAEALVSTYQNAYRQRVAELDVLKSETALKQDELEECETRAQHLKMQLQDLGDQCTVQKEKADLLEGLVREEPSAECSPYQHARMSEIRAGDVGVRHEKGVGRAASDSGFESDGDSIFSSHAEQQQQHEIVMSRDPKTPTMSSPNARSTTTSISSSPMMYSSHGYGDLRHENEVLRARVAELEGAVEGCLDMLSNPLAM